VHVELFTPSHTDTKSTLPLPLCHKSQMQRMPEVEGQWDFYPNLRLKIKHTLSACGTFYDKSHRYKKYATTTIMSQITNAVYMHHQLTTERQGHFP